MEPWLENLNVLSQYMGYLLCRVSKRRKDRIWEKWRLRHHQMLRKLDILVEEISLLAQLTVKRSLKVQKLYYNHSSFILVFKTHFIKRRSVSEVLTWQNGSKFQGHLLLHREKALYDVFCCNYSDYSTIIIPYQCSCFCPLVSFI